MIYFLIASTVPVQLEHPLLLLLLLPPLPLPLPLPIPSTVGSRKRGFTYPSISNPGLGHLTRYSNTQQHYDNTTSPHYYLPTSTLPSTSLPFPILSLRETYSTLEGRLANNSEPPDLERVVGDNSSKTIERAIYTLALSSS